MVHVRTLRNQKPTGPAAAGRTGLMGSPNTGSKPPRPQTMQPYGGCHTMICSDDCSAGLATTALVVAAALGEMVAAEAAPMPAMDTVPTTPATARARAAREVG